jgi:hypothetical protein
VTTTKQWSGEAIEAAAAAQGIALAPGRAERLARGQQALLDAGAGDALRGSLAFDVDPPAFLLAIERCRAP